MSLFNMFMGAVDYGPPPPPGQQAYTTPGTYTWVCPAGLTSICVVCIGGGGAGASSRGASSSSGGNSSFSTLCVAGGGTAGRVLYTSTLGLQNNQGTVITGTGWSGASGYYFGNFTAGYGGGAGYLGGQAPSGAPTTNDWTAGGGGGGSVISGFTANTAPVTTSIIGPSGAGNNYGGGGGGGRDGSGGGGGACAYVNNIAVVPGGSYTVVVGARGVYTPSGTDNYAANGGGGAVRIIWGAGRAFPSTNTGDV